MAIQPRELVLPRIPLLLTLSWADPPLIALLSEPTERINRKRSRKVTFRHSCLPLAFQDFMMVGTKEVSFHLMKFFLSPMRRMVMLYVYLFQSRNICSCFARQIFFLFHSSTTIACISTDTFSSFNPLSILIPSPRPKPTVSLLFLIRIILSIMSIVVWKGQEIMISLTPLLSKIPL